MIESNIRILLIEDRQGEASTVKKMLSQNGNPSYQIECVSDLPRALEFLSQESANIILLDLGLENSEGLDSLRKVHEQSPVTPVVVLTEKENNQLALEAIREGAQDYILKGELNADVLLRSIRYAIERKYVDDQLQDKEEQLRTLVANIPGAICRFIEDSGRKLVFASDMIKEITGHTPQEFVQDGVLSYDGLVFPEDSEDVAKAIERAVTDNRPYNIVYRIRHANGTVRWVRERGRCVKLPNMPLRTIDAAIFDITEGRQAQKQLQHMSYHDSLTGLPNRVLFIDRFNQAIARARREKYTTGALFIGLDFFKRINNALGHITGDHLLREIALRLKEKLYETDTITRIAGDEFVILLPKMDKADDADPVVRKVFEVFKEPYYINEHEFYMTCSVGMSLFPNHGRNSENLLKNANIAMHYAKKAGGNCFRLYSLQMRHKAPLRFDLENSLHHALGKGEFRLYYQPMIDLQTGKITAAESLIRWEHPDLGLVMPNDFIPLAEETGMILEIGKWVLQDACRQNKAWQDAGLPPIVVSVNISAQQFQHAKLASHVEEVLKKTGLDPQYLELELTEGMIMKDIQGTVMMLQHLKSMGLRISIDDFGTGHSSLSHLKRFPVSTLKIDRSFVQDLATDNDDAEISKAIISMAHNLKLKVVAEGVENDDQLNFFKENQCDLVQGFYFSKPIPAKDFANLLNKNREQSWPRNFAA